MIYYYITISYNFAKSFQMKIPRGKPRGIDLAFQSGFFTLNYILQHNRLGQRYLVKGGQHAFGSDA